MRRFLELAGSSAVVALAFGLLVLAIGRLLAPIDGDGTIARADRRAAAPRSRHDADVPRQMVMVSVFAARPAPARIAISPHVHRRRERHPKPTLALGPTHSQRRHGHQRWIAEVPDSVNVGRRPSLLQATAIQRESSMGETATSPKAPSTEIAASSWNVAGEATPPAGHAKHSLAPTEAFSARPRRAHTYAIVVVNIHRAPHAARSNGPHQTTLRFLVATPPQDGVGIVEAPEVTLTRGAR